jgi:hypothetical protein
MNVEIGTEAAQFPEKEYINGIFLAVRQVYSKYPTLQVTIRFPFSTGLEEGIGDLTYL